MRCQGQVLVHHLDAEVLGLPRTGQVQLPTLEVDLTLVQVEVARQRLDERRLAGTVVADQSDDLPGLDVEIGVVQRADVAEAAREAPRFKQCSHAVPSVEFGVRCGGQVVPGRQTSNRTSPWTCQSPHDAGTTSV